MGFAWPWVKVFWNVYVLKSVQGWFRFGVRFCLGLVQGCVQGFFEIVPQKKNGFRVQFGWV